MFGDPTLPIERCPVDRSKGFWHGDDAGGLGSFSDEGGSG